MADPGSGAAGGGPSSVPQLIDQAEIDALMAAARTAKPVKPAAPLPSAKDTLEQSVPTPSTVAWDSVKDLGLLNQDEIEGVMAKQSPATPPPPATPPIAPQTNGGNTTQDEIDRLLRELAAGGTLPPAEEPAPVEPNVGMDQSEIDRLLAAAEAEPTNFAATEAAIQKIDQTEIDAMLATGGGESLPSEPDTTDILSQAELDKLLAAIEPDKQITDAELDAVIGAQGEADASGMDAAIHTDSAPLTLGQDELDALLASHPMTRSTPPAPLPIAQAQEPEEDPLERAARENAKSNVGQENLAAAAPSADAVEQPLGQDLIDSLLAQAAQAAAAAAPAHGADAIADSLSGVDLKPRDDMAVELSDDDFADMGMPAPVVQKQAPEESSAEPAAQAQVPASEEESPVVARRLKGQSRFSTKLVASAAAALLIGAGSFFALWNIRTKPPEEAPAAESPAAPNLAEAIAAAKGLMGQGEFVSAMKELGRAIRHAEPGPLLDEARFLHVEAGYRSLPPKPSEVDTETVLKNIEDVVSLQPAYERNPEALEWKADLYKRTGALTTARDTYDRILSNYPKFPNLDRVLLEQAKLAFELKYYDEAAKSLTRVVSEFPQSIHKSEAQMLLAQSYEATGRVPEAVATYTTVAAERTDSRVGAEAALALARIANAAGDVPRAILALESRLQTATTVEGNDAVYVELAKAYRAAGKPADAVRVARELLSFFPESPQVPDAVVELTQALDAAGDRTQALELSKQSVERFDKNAQIAKNRALLLNKSNDPRATAEAMVKADELGANDPALVLDAGRKYNALGEKDTATQLLKRVIDAFPESSQAIDAGIDLARMEYGNGDLAGAIDRLSALAASPSATTQQLAIQTALGDIYHDLGLTKRATTAFEKVAALTQDPEALAHAAIVFMENKEMGQALPLIAKLDPARLSSKSGFQLLMAQGRALLPTEPDKALEKMQQAFEQFPVERTPDDFEYLVRACLETGKTAHARVLVSDLDTFVQTHPEERPRLQRTAALWGDALYDAGDYRAALDAYALAAPPPPPKQEPLPGEAPDAQPQEETETKVPPDEVWARFQRANAMLKLDDYTNSLPILDELAASDTQFAEDARLKAQYARIEQRLRGERVAPPAAQQGG